MIQKIKSLLFLLIFTIILVPDLITAMENREITNPLFKTKRKRKGRHKYSDPAMQAKFHKAVENYAKAHFLLNNKEETARRFFREVAPKEYFDSKWDLGKKCYNKGDFDNAQLHLSSLFSDKQKNPKSHTNVPFGSLSFMLGKIHQKKEDLDTALEMYETAIEHNHLYAYFAAAAIYEQKKQYFPAIAYLIKVIDTATDEPTRKMAYTKLQSMQARAQEEQDNNKQTLVIGQLQHTVPESPANTLPDELASVQILCNQ